MLRIATVLICGLLAAPAFAQSPYVAATIGVDASFPTRSETNGIRNPDGDTTAVGAALRLGTSLGSRWGVELELARPGELRSTVGPIAYPLLGSVTSTTIAVPPVNTVGFFDGRPIAAAPVRSRQRNMTLSPVAWVRQRVSDSVDVVYLGGVGFSRAAQSVDIDYGVNVPPQVLALIPVSLRSFHSRTTSYGVGPVVGAEARIAMTGHLRLVPGVRLHSLGNQLTDGWLIRTTVGLGWTF